MSADKYPSIFSRQMKAIVYLTFEQKKGVDLNNYLPSFPHGEITLLFLLNIFPLLDMHDVAYQLNF